MLLAFHRALHVVSETRILELTSTGTLARVDPRSNQLDTVLSGSRRFLDPGEPLGPLAP
jgi:hypothetical protein